jgi:trk system potassium uptake protein TrkA
LDTVLSLGRGGVEVVEVEVPPLVVGRTVRDLTVLGEVHVVAISRGAKTFLPTTGTVFQVGDLIHVAVAEGSAGRLTAFLGLA